MTIVILSILKKKKNLIHYIILFKTTFIIIGILYNLNQ